MIENKFKKQYFKKIFAIDTNIILDNAQNFLNLSENGKNLIVIPEIVLDEIDSKKSGFNEINFQAREFGRMLFDAEICSKTKIELDNITLTIIEVKLGDTYIHIISKSEYKADEIQSDLKIKNDRKILEVIKNLKDNFNFYKHIKFISLDIMARTRAISLDIEAEPLTLGLNKEEKLEFVREIEVETIPKEGTDIIEIDKDYKPNYFNYIIKHNGREILSYIKNDKIYFLDEKAIRRQAINPMNREQQFFSNAILDNYFNILIVDALAGSGKTLLAISGAMELIRKKEYSKIVYIRNSIESLDKGEDVGYLPGLEEKFIIYNYPLYDTLEFLARKKLKQSKENKPGKGKDSPITKEKIQEEIDNMISKYQIETVWTGALRGRTISDAVVIIDEAQNMSNSTALLTLSRIDSSCKVIVIGSNRQIDNQFVTKYTNGLSVLLHSTKEKHEEVNLFAIELKKVVRGPITAFAERVFSKNKRD